MGGLSIKRLCYGNFASTIIYREVSLFIAADDAVFQYINLSIVICGKNLQKIFICRKIGELGQLAMNELLPWSVPYFNNMCPK